MVGFKVLELVRTWLHLDFFSRPEGEGDTGSALTATIFTQSFLAFLLAALTFDSEVELVAYCAGNLSLVTVLVGFTVLGDPGRSDRRAADRMLLGTAPLRRSQLLTARILHQAFYLVLITVGTALPSAILTYWVSDGALWVVPAYLVLACLLAGHAAGALALAARCAERWAGPLRAALWMGSLRGVVLGGLVVAMALCLPHLHGQAEELPFGTGPLEAWSPYWAARWLGDPGWNPWLLRLLGLSALLFVAGLALGEGSEASGRERRREGGLLARSDGVFAPQGGPLLGYLRFLAAMLYRSSGFRARILPLLGMPLALVLLAFWAEQGEGLELLLGMTLQFPAIYLPFLILFLPYADEPGSSWVFATSPGSSLQRARGAVAVVLATRLLLPVHLGCAGLALLAGVSPLTVCVLGTASLGIAVHGTCLQVRKLEAQPFTVDEDPAEGLVLDGVLGWALLLAALGAVLSTVASRGAVGVLVGFALLATGVLHLRRVVDEPAS